MRSPLSPLSLVLALSLAILFAGMSLPASAGTTDIPRVLMVGDSWPAFIQLFRNFEVAFEDYPEFEDYGHRGKLTTEVGVYAAEFNTPAYLDQVTAELLSYPTIDIVHLSLGGNDFIGSGLNASMTPAEIQAKIDDINGHTQDVIDHVLAIRPNIRIALCGYTFGDHPVSGFTTSELNALWVQFEESRLLMALNNERVYYIHNLGLAQYHYGIPDAEPPIPAYPEAGHVPYPGGYADAYSPMPGGNPDYNAPLEALMDDDLHLTMDGYDILAHRCMDEFYEEWLAYPAVLEILPLPSGAKSPFLTFEVTFSKAVTGVDVTDFTATAGSGAPVVTEVTGSGAFYAVTVDVAGASGDVELQVIDDDTILSTDTSTPLGGTDAGNGGFSYNGQMKYADEPMPSEDDFDACMTLLDETFRCAAWMLGGESFMPDSCDANGGTINIDPPDIVGNNMLDTCELGVLYACLDDPTLDLSAYGGVTHAMALEAWNHNFARMHSDLGGAEGRILRCLLGMDTLLAGYMTLGDTGSRTIPTLLMTAVSIVIPLPAGTQVPVATNYMTLGDYLGHDGDADGDGYTNREEYEYFMPIGGKELYVMAALDPAMAPETLCSNSEGGTFDQGDRFCLVVPDPVELDGDFEWLKDGLAVQNDRFIAGANWRELHFLHLRPSDSGTYECVYNGGSSVFGPITIEVEEPSVPVAGPLGLGLLGLGLSLAAHRKLRRRK